MITTILKLLLPSIVPKILDVWDNHNARKLSREKLRSEVEKAILSSGETLGQEQASLIKAEIQSDSWLAKNWRPLTALTFVFIIVWYILILPILVDWFGFPPLRIGDNQLRYVENSTLVMITGYVGGRTLEKITKMITSRWT